MTLNILISCYNESVKDVQNIFLSPRADVRYIVSHQLSPDYAAAHPGLTADASLQFSGRSDVVYSPFVGKGLSQNRNHCLDVLESILEAETGQSVVHKADTQCIESCILKEQLCVISDDDIGYTDAWLSRIIEIFDERPWADVLCFRIATPDGQPEFKDYPEKEFEIRKVPVYGNVYFSAVEIAFRYEPVRKSGIRFDENFGLGSQLWPEGGEETVFLSDCHKAGMRMVYVPEYLVQHPFFSTGKKLKTVRKARMLEAVALRCRGRLSFAAFVGRLRVLYRRALSAAQLFSFPTSPLK